MRVFVSGEPVDAKACNRCGVTKMLVEFHIGASIGGRNSICKECRKSDSKKYYESTAQRQRREAIDRYNRNRQKRLVQMREYHYNHRKERKEKLATTDAREKVNSRMREYRKLPEVRRKDSARSALKRAIKSGKVIRKPCSKCGGEKSQGHHEDYSRPLDVVWLCRNCHSEIHRAQ